MGDTTLYSGVRESFLHGGKVWKANEGSLGKKKCVGKRERWVIRLQAAVKEQCAKQSKELFGAVVQHWV